MGESTSVKRQVKPWVAVVIVTTAIIIGGVTLAAVGGLRLGRSRRYGRVTERGTSERNQANNLCRRLNMAGNSYAISGFHDSALTCYREAARIAKKHGLVERMAASYHDMCGIFEFKRMPESVRFYMNAATALSQGRKSQVASGLLDEGTFRFRSLGDLDSGKTLLDAALRQSRLSGNRWAEAVALCQLGSLHSTLAHLDSALALYESCAAVSREIGDRPTEAGALHGIAHVCFRRDQLDSAMSWLIRAIEVAHKGGLMGDEASALFDVALIRAEKGELALARAQAEQALKLFTGIGDNGGMNACRNLISDLEDAERSEYRSRKLDSLLERHKSRPDPGM